MKAKDMLLELNRGSIFNGNAFLREKNLGKRLTILKGKLIPSALYYSSFNMAAIIDEPDVILTLCTNEKQFLWKIEEQQNISCDACHFCRKCLSKKES
jgi:hypothetical protein